MMRANEAGEQRAFGLRIVVVVHQLRDVARGIVRQQHADNPARCDRVHWHSEPAKMVEHQRCDQGRDGETHKRARADLVDEREAGINLDRSVEGNVEAELLHEHARDQGTGDAVSGKFDFTLDVSSAGTDASARGPVPRESFSDRVRAAIEQFGFRLESQRVTVDVTALDHVERPTEN
ncbi:MAG: DUF3738 domain-containing protein [Candidatus Sulfopaludibacter sp.]|nr:DUF3738 domain-containing protein [Candidatus Sulfopaludibacter sp.]